MKIRILYDNQAEKGLRAGWGFSALVDETTLFDTGEDAEALFGNMSALGVDLSRVERVVLSHEDWDHTGGLAILRKLGPVSVFFPASFSSGLKEDMLHDNSRARLVEVSKRLEIAPGLFVTDELGRAKREIALVQRLERGVAILTGCAHPGLDEIMRNVADMGEVAALVGGFHDFDRLEALAGVPRIIPTHCTRQKERILERYPEQTKLVNVGTEVVL